jgi:hypothetical protein
LPGSFSCYYVCVHLCACLCLPVEEHRAMSSINPSLVIERLLTSLLRGSWVQIRSLEAICTHPLPRPSPRFSAPSKTWPTSWSLILRFVASRSISGWWMPRVFPRCVSSFWPRVLWSLCLASMRGFMTICWECLPRVSHLLVGEKKAELVYLTWPNSPLFVQHTSATPWVISACKPED